MAKELRQHRGLQAAQAQLWNRQLLEEERCHRQDHRKEQTMLARQLDRCRPPHEHLGQNRLEVPRATFPMLD